VVAIAPLGLQDDVDVDEIDADSEVIAGPPDADVETEPLVEVDPLAELRTQIGGAARRDELERLQNQVRSELGRSQRLEARLDAMAGANPLADVDPRLDASEQLLTGIADALIDSDLTDDRMKSALRASRSALDTAKGVRAQSRMREELKTDILAALPKPSVAPETQADDPWVQATVDVVAELRERLPDLYPPTMSDQLVVASIPKAKWNEGLAKGTPTRAAAHVLRWVEQQAQESATDRIAARRQAAGSGAPARTGVPANDEDTIARYADGDRTVSQEQYEAANHRLGLD